MSSSSLHKKAVSATFWSGIDAFARQGLQFVITLILARLLTPKDYGTVGLLAVFIGVAAVFVDSGFPSALIQRKEPSDIDLSSVFYFNIGMSLVVALLLCLIAPWVARFYEMPVLKPLTWLLAANLVIGSFGTIQSVLLTKALNFRRQCVITISAIIISGAFAIYLAWRNYGIWSLGIQTLVATIVTTTLLWVTSSWRPSWVFSVASIRSLFRFGSFLLMSNMLDMVYNRINTLIIGKFYSAKELGYYSRADNTRLIPGTLLSTIIGRVAFPIFVAAREDKEMLKAGLRKAITTVMMINIPAMVGMAVTAPTLVKVLFGDQWLPCVPYLQILCLGGILWPLHILNLNVLTAQGHSNLFFSLEIIKKTLGILIVGTACFYGVIAIAWSTVLAGVIGYCVNAYYSGRFLKYGALRQTMDLLPYFGAALIMGCCSWGFAFLPITSPALLLTGQVVVGAIVYGIICAVFRLGAFVEVCKIGRPVLARRFAWAKA